MSDERPLSIFAAPAAEERCGQCGARADELYLLDCSCGCNFQEGPCCRACASPAALRVIAGLLEDRAGYEERELALRKRPN